MLVATNGVCRLLVHASHAAELGRFVSTLMTRVLQESTSVLVFNV